MKLRFISKRPLITTHEQGPLPGNLLKRPYGLPKSKSTAFFPDGRPARGQHIFRVLDDNELEVGFLWIGLPREDRPNLYWVQDIQIDGLQRGQGLGKAAMSLAEDEVRACGGTELGLNVFGHNPIAKSLFESMGYTTTATIMRRVLRDDDEQK